MFLRKIDDIIYGQPPQAFLFFWVAKVMGCLGPLANSKLYTPNTLNTDFIFWYTQMTVVKYFKIKAYFFHFWSFWSESTFYIELKKKSGLNFRLRYCLRFQVLFDVQTYLPETSPFLLSSIHQMFIVLGMYNFGPTVHYAIMN